MQEQLNKVYEEFQTEAKAISQTLIKQLTAPILIQLPEQWEQSKKRILIVGQETMGWSYDKDEHPERSFPDIKTFEDFLAIPESIPAMLETYRYFEFAKVRPKNHRSPYWRAYRQIRESIGDKPDGFETHVITTNLFRMSYGGKSILKKGRPVVSKDDYEKILNMSGSLLKKELEILKPSSVIFFTGPYYNNPLYSIFKDCHTVDWHNHNSTRTSNIDHHLLPKKTFRTYHPGYLNRGHWNIVNEIIKDIK